MTSVRRWSAIPLLGLVIAGASAPRAQTPASFDRGLLDRYCISCHGPRQRAGGLVLADLDPGQLDRDAGTWEHVVERIRGGTMPPAGMPRPEPADGRAFAEAVESALDRAADAAPSPGRPVLRRLTRVEYANVIRDLLALDIDAQALLPADKSFDGFDNAGAALSTSPALMERYLLAARRISRLAVGSLDIGPAFAAATYEAPQDLWQSARLDEDAPFGSRGGISIRHHFPLDGEYVVRVHLRRNILGYVRGLGDAHELDIRLDGTRVTRVTIGGERRGTPAPLSFSGVIAGDAAWEAYAISADQNLSVSLPVKAGTRSVGVSFVDELWADEGVQQPPLDGLSFSYDESRTSPTGPWGPAVDSVTIDGPYGAAGAGQTPSRARLFTCQPAAPDSVEPCARAILSSVATRAYRRAITEQDMQPLLQFFHAGLTRGGFDEGIRAAVERVLVDPSLLFRLERDPDSAAPGVAYRVSDVELASRLSFFLWSSGPDEALLDAAIAGRLHDPQVLRGQVGRMLADRRASMLADNFAVQWLALRRLSDAAPDPDLFPEFDGNLRQAFERETRLFVGDEMRRDQSLLALLDADYTFVNERLARHYGIPNVHGNQFRRVTLTDRTRAGLLGQGSILTLTSLPGRTSPVLRGRWVLDTIFGMPTPPPPANIPEFPPSTSDAGILSVRQRTERHRTNPVCASCHARMDPLGFALENFDAIGRWRGTGESGVPIDASGSLPDGTPVSGADELRRAILRQPDGFLRATTGKLLAYAIGRGLEPSDGPAIRRIVRESAGDGYRWSAIIQGVVRSAPFLMRKAAS
jgi:hypothetical protein